MARVVTCNVTCVSATSLLLPVCHSVIITARRSVIFSATVPQVLVTPHAAFLTNEALENIATTTITNLMEVGG